MNLGIVVHHLDLREGTGGYVAELLPRIAQKHEVTLYAASVRSPVPENVQVVHVPALRGRAYATILSFPYAFAAVRDRHDLVHAQGWVTPRADVVTAHIVLAAWRHASRVAGAPQALGERYFGRYVQRQEAKLLGRARAIIAPSARAKHDLATWYGHTGKIHLVPHGFPPVAEVTVPSARSDLGIPEDAFVALYVGDGRKGLLQAVRAVAATDECHLLVASHSRPGPYLSEATSLGVSPRVHWPGAQHDMARVYAASDVLLHPTIYDTFGLVVAEAMAAGVPVIVGCEAGVCDLIEHGESGWIVNGVVETGAALESLRTDPGLRARLAERAKAVAAAHSWDETARRTLAVYETAAAR